MCMHGLPLFEVNTRDVLCFSWGMAPCRCAAAAVKLYHGCSLFLSCSFLVALHSGARSGLSRVAGLKCSGLGFRSWHPREISRKATPL